MLEDVLEDFKLHMNGEGISLKEFADECELSEKTIRRFIKGETISVSSLLTIFQKLYKDDHLKAINALYEKFPDNEQILAIRRNALAMKTATAFDYSTREFWTANDISYKIMCLLTHSVGIERRVIDDAYGSEGLSILDRLIALGKVEKLESNNYRLFRYAFATGDGQLLREMIVKTAQCYDPGTYGTPDGQIGWSTGRTDEVGLAKIKDILMQAVCELTKVEHEHPGNIPFVYSTTLSKLLPKSELNDTLN